MLRASFPPPSSDILSRLAAVEQKDLPAYPASNYNKYSDTETASWSSEFRGLATATALHYDVRSRPIPAVIKFLHTTPLCNYTGRFPPSASTESGIVQ